MTGLLLAKGWIFGFVFSSKIIFRVKWETKPSKVLHSIHWGRYRGFSAEKVYEVCVFDVYQVRGINGSPVQTCPKTDFLNLGYAADGFRVQKFIGNQKEELPHLH
ncbi:hypothetical protein JTE90_001078 [Oedothorax gibbosus]|uniref:Uncharacterized protein n=1 Tax=Oedothorax gibbosus TaxID=931172 RepID=A0AAV6TMU6_9ARAC|nr:hypothetical protein JTE90_001078 [Oedothorax gibbosus]